MQTPILMYHFLGEPVEPGDRPYCVGVEEFANQMNFLKNKGFHTIDLHQLVNHIFEGKPIPRRSVVLSFDDGDISFYRVAFPVLKAQGFTATMFLITSKIGTEGYMDWEQIIEMQNSGFSFESHSLTHPIITEISPNQAEEEISCSKEILEKRLKAPIRFFAYRGGHFNDQIKEFVSSAGYRAAVCSNRGYNDQNSDRFALYRIPIRGSDSLSQFCAKLFNMDPQRSVPRFVARYLMPFIDPIRCLRSTQNFLKWIRKG